MKQDIFSNVENITSNSPLCNDKRFLKVKEMSLELLLISCCCTYPVFKLIKNNNHYLTKRNKQTYLYTKVLFLAKERKNKK